MREMHVDNDPLISPCVPQPHLVFFFFFNDPAPPEIYPLSLHAALPISAVIPDARMVIRGIGYQSQHQGAMRRSKPLHLFKFGVLKVVSFYNDVPFSQESAIASPDRKSTRLNSSHLVISYAVFCLKKKNK